VQHVLPDVLLELFGMPATGLHQRAPVATCALVGRNNRAGHILAHQFLFLAAEEAQAKRIDAWRFTLPIPAQHDAVRAFAQFPVLPLSLLQLLRRSLAFADVAHDDRWRREWAARPYPAGLGTRRRAAARWPLRPSRSRVDSEPVAGDRRFIGDTQDRRTIDILRPCRALVQTRPPGLAGNTLGHRRSTRINQRVTAGP